MQLSCPVCASRLEEKGKSMHSTLFYCWKCAESYEVINRKAPNLDSREGKARLSRKDVQLIKAARNG